MDLIIAKDYEEMSRAGADIFADLLRNDPSAVLGLATGSTPIGLYQSLVADCDAGRISFADVTTFNLDEYCQLPVTDVNSYRYFMDHNLFDKVDIDPAHVHLPNGNAPDREAECLQYEDAIARAGGIDIQLLGLGHNGHIGFNEPASDFPVITHVVDLTPSTIDANARFFDSEDDVPKQAITMGIGTIMKARRIVLLASGEGKADIVARSAFGPVMPSVPASVLQLHPNVTVIVDEAAAAALPRA